MKIGKVTLKNNVFVAPLAGISNGAFRSIAASFGAGLIYTEMVSDKGLLHKNKRTRKMIEVEDDEGAVSLQLFGADPNQLAEAVKIVDQESRAVLIDLNAGCPVPKVVKSNGGAMLMREEVLLESIVTEMVKATDKPITVKIRSGWDQNSLNAVSIAKRVEAAGAKAIAIHGRTRKAMYSGKVNLDHIKAVVEAVDIPVIGNGDIKTPEDAKAMMEYTGCAGVMIGRGVLGNPWLIKQTVDYLNTGTYDKDIAYEEKLDMIKLHTNKLIALKGEKVALLEMRSHVPWYLKGLPHAIVVKQAMTKITTKMALFDLLDEYFSRLD